MSKITIDGLTRSGTVYFIAVPYGNSARQRVNQILLSFRCSQLASAEC